MNRVKNCSDEPSILKINLPILPTDTQNFLEKQPLIT